MKISKKSCWGLGDMTIGEDFSVLRFEQEMQSTVHKFTQLFLP